MTGLTHDSSGDWDGLMCSALSAVPGVFRWAFWAGRNPRCVSGPSPDLLDQMYSQHYMLYHLRMVGVSQRYSLDVDVYLLLLSVLFDLHLTLFVMSRNEFGVQSLKVQVTTRSNECVEGADCNLLFVSDVDDFASFFSPVLNKKTQLIHDLHRVVGNLDEVEVLSKCSGWVVFDDPPKRVVKVKDSKRKNTCFAEGKGEVSAVKRSRLVEEPGIKKRRAMQFVNDRLLTWVKFHYELGSDGKDTLKSSSSLLRETILGSETNSLEVLACSSENSSTLPKVHTNAEMLEMWDNLIDLVRDGGEESVSC